MEKKFYVFNSFTTTPFEGNPAGVVLDAADLNTDTMQAIARQLNLVETVFAFPNPAPGIDYELRYFMPHGELPVAGHPTIAAWACLLKTGTIDTKNKSDFVQKTGAGNIRIKIQDGKIYASQKTATVNVLADFPWDDAYRIFNLQENDVDSHSPPAMVDAGLGHIVFCVRSLDALMKMKFQPEELGAFCKKFGARECQIFCQETIAAGLTGHTRNLCPRYGLEDPACGNGSAALGTYYARFVDSGKPAYNLAFEQGHIVNMPAVVEVLVNGDDVMIGGHAVQMIEGTLTL